MDVTLVMFKQDGQRRDFDIKKEATTIGRNTDCDFQIPLSVVSRRHCQIVAKGNSLTIRDLGSSNGTFVNGKRVQEATLSAGDTIVVGPVTFTVVIDGSPSDVNAVRTVVDGGVAPADAPEMQDGTVDVEAELAESDVVEDMDEVEEVEAVEELEEVDEEAEEEEDTPQPANPLAALEALSKKKK